MAFKGDDSTLSLATTVTLALAVAAMVFTKNPLQSSRPPGSGTGLQQVTGELSVRARLWEDPFVAVEKVVAASRQQTVQIAIDGKTIDMVAVTAGMLSPSQGDGLKGLHRKIKEVGAKRILALVVMTQGESSIEGSEARIRDRYAVGAALEVGCFSPDKGESLSYFFWNAPSPPQVQILRASDQTRSKASGKELETKSVSQYTPYEWYGRTVTGSCRQPDKTPEDSISDVLVLWVKAQEGEDKILARVSELVSKFPGISTKLIGPRTSSEFLSILKEIKKRNPHSMHRWQQLGQMLQVYSPWATAMAGVLLRELKSWKNESCQAYATCEKALRELLRTAGLELAYRVTSDEVLFESLLKELARRQVTVGDDKIVLIGEWDSFYARALPFSFTVGMHQYFQKRQVAERHPTSLASRAAAPNLDEACRSIAQIDPLRAYALCSDTFNIAQYSYLSGLDGDASGDQAKRSKSKKEERGKDKTEEGERFRDIGSYERPEGTSQLDYVRRLVTRIKAEQPKVKAIGILGKDTYDALLILQALREQFPNALFFTTDLDARYFHEDEQKWTRNLIVASQFGLQLEPSLQQTIPPFRSSLQTSAFYAVLQAVDWVAPQPEATIPPRIFEIGRHGAIDLSVEDSILNGRSIHPMRGDVADDKMSFRLPSRIELLWVVGLLLVFLLLWGYGRLWNWMTARAERDQSKRRLLRVTRASWVFITVILALVFWCKIIHFSYAEDEPFSWSDGVSIWPTEALRLVVAFLSLFFLLKAHADSVRNIVEVTKSFFPDVASRPQVSGCWNSMKGFRGDLCWMFHGFERAYPCKANDLWMRYCRAHSVCPRIGRVTLGLVVYLFLIVPLWLFMNDGELRLFVPCRGTFSCSIDGKILGLSVLLFLALNVAVLDAVILCTRWIQEMPAADGLKEMEQIRLIVERTKIVNRRILYPFLALFILIAARSHYFDNWDFPPVLILVLTVNTLVALASVSMLYLAAMQAKRRTLAAIQERLDRTMGQIQEATLEPITTALDRSIKRLRQIITDINSLQQGAFAPFYQQPVVQATLVAALAFLQYWYLGQ